MTNKTGRAYAFFDCDASREELERAMPDIKDKARTLEGLEMQLYEGTSELQFDERLTEALAYPDEYRVMTPARKAQGYEEERVPLRSLKYAIVAESGTVGDERVASELGDVLDVIRADFNRDQELYRGAITYENNGEYVLWEPV